MGYDSAIKRDRLLTHATAQCLTQILDGWMEGWRVDGRKGERKD